MKKNIFPTLLLLLFSCGQKSTKTTQNEKVIFDSAVKPSYIPDQLLIDEWHVLVYAHPDVDKESIGEIKLKFLTTVWFDDYPVKPISKNITKAPINYNSHRIAREYKTAISQQYESEAVNFAGHYVFVIWGCGAPCTGSAIVDALNGNVYPGPASGSGFQHQIDSRMLLGNPPDSAGYYNFDIDGCCTPEIYIFNDLKKTFEYQEIHDYETTQ